MGDYLQKNATNAQWDHHGAWYPKRGLQSSGTSQEKIGSNFGCVGGGGRDEGALLGARVSLPMSPQAERRGGRGRFIHSYHATEDNEVCDDLQNDPIEKWWRWNSQ
jgi:hypothetical protein